MRKLFLTSFETRRPTRAQTQFLKSYIIHVSTIFLTTKHLKFILSIAQENCSYRVNTRRPTRAQTQFILYNPKINGKFIFTYVHVAGSSHFNQTEMLHYRKSHNRSHSVCHITGSHNRFVTLKEVTWKSSPDTLGSRSFPLVGFLRNLCSRWNLHNKIKGIKRWK